MPKPVRSMFSRAPSGPATSTSAALESAPDAADRAELYGLRARHRTVTGAFGEAIEAARAGLAPFGIDLPEGEAAGARAQAAAART